jgi:hypothetical protein
MPTTVFDVLKMKKLNGHIRSDNVTTHTANNYINAVAEV